MTKVLVLKSAVTGAASVSNKLVGEFVRQLRERDPSAAIVTRDLGADPVPHLLPETVAGIRATAQTETEKAALAQSDALRSEERRSGKECGSKCGSRWAPYHEKKNKIESET